jgi:hypothetical protein
LGCPGIGCHLQRGRGNGSRFHSVSVAFVFEPSRTVGDVARLYLLLFVTVLVAEAASGLLGTGVFWAFRQFQVHRSGFLIFVVSYVLAAWRL